MSERIYKRYLPITICLLQLAALFLLRKLWLRTVFQTVATYLLLCAMGLFLLLWSQKKNKYILRQLWDCYLIFWSGIHAVIVLGFMTCGTFYLTWTQVTFVQIVNLFLGCALYWILFILLKRPDRAISVGNILTGILGIANFYLVKFRGSPFRLADIGSVRTAENVVKSYDFRPSAILVLTVIDMILWYLIWRKYYCRPKTEIGKERRKEKWANPVSILATVVIAAGCIGLPIIRYDVIYANTFQFANDTCLADLLAEMMGSGDSLPDSYSIEKVQQIMNDFLTNSDNQEDMQVTQNPNIVIIMNESFADLRVLNDFETDVPMLKFWDSLEENTLRGWANVSILGGNTANSEYEFLTSDTLGVYGNRVPYANYFDGRDSYPGLVSVLKNQGYYTTAFHPYMSSGWNRVQVYHSMQFDETIFLDDISQDLDPLRLYVSDKGDYSYIKNWFENKEPGIPHFFFNITMQNHGGYTYSGDDFETTVHMTGSERGCFPEAEQYMSLIKASDEALEELLSYFAQYPEPVVVIVFGDHQPKLEDEFYTYITGQPLGNWNLEQKMNLYKTPFIIWHNYPTENRDLGNVSLNYLAAILLDDIGLDMSPYQRYTLTKYTEMPVVTSIGMINNEGKVWAMDSSESEEWLSDYELLIYNHTVDKEERIENFFDVSDNPTSPLSVKSAQ